MRDESCDWLVYSLCAVILFIAYWLHVKYQPFLEPSVGKGAATFASLTSGDVILNYVRFHGVLPLLIGTTFLAHSRLQDEIVKALHLRVCLPARACLHWQQLRYNALEMSYLVCGMFVLLSGMVFQSGMMMTDDPGFTAFTIVVRM